MSATLRVSDFAENRVMFPLPPIVINIASRQYPVRLLRSLLLPLHSLAKVTIRYARETPMEEEIIEATVAKVVKVHKVRCAHNDCLMLTSHRSVRLA